MADSLPLGLDRAEARTRLDRWLIGTLNARRLEKVRRGFSDGWRLAVSVAGTDLELDIEIPEDYPRALPSLFLVNPPPFGTWPHVEITGRLCIAAPTDRYDRSRPIDVVKSLLEGALDILNKGVTGVNADDFRSEFLSYWDIGARGPEVQSILDPSGPSRAIKLWRKKTLAILLAETTTDIRRWLSNLGQAKPTDMAIEEAILLWLGQPLLPSEYPTTVDALYTIAATAEGDGIGLLDRLFRQARGHVCQVILGADAGNGSCFGGVEMELRRIDRPRKTQRSAPEMPQTRLEKWKVAKVTRTRVTRADAFWVHGRDSNPDLTTLRLAKVALVGCGSLGAPVARLLAQAGVAELRLVDPEIMEWANVGRHVLGGIAKGQRKALALATQLGRDFPHSRFRGFAGRWQDNVEALQACDLIISTTGSLDDEAELMRWQQANPGTRFVFGWTEPRACAAQTVAVLPGGGCLLCGFDHVGNPQFQVTSWEETPLMREAACGSWFMPYGADAIMAAAVLTTGLALDVLMDRAAPGAHRVSSARAEVLEAAGGDWSAIWRFATGEGGASARTIERIWLPNIHCPSCAGEGPA